MKKFAQLIVAALFLLLYLQTYGQVNNKSLEHNVKISNELEQKVYPIGFNFHPKTNTTFQKLASIISPLSQTICSGQAITNIVASPDINNKLILNCRNDASLEYLNVQDSGIFFDVSNSSSQLIRINSFSLTFTTPVTTTNATAVLFRIYKTTNALTAESNYTTQENWTKIADYNATFSSTTANAQRNFTVELGDSGFTLNSNESKGIYIVVTTLANGFKIVHRNNATTQTLISDGVLTVINKVNSNGLFSTNSNDNIRGFYGNVNYQTGNYGFWSRLNATLVTGTGSAGYNFSKSNENLFPISGTLTNNSIDNQATIYNITEYDINGTREDHIAEVVVTTSTVSNTVTQNGNTLTADQDGAMYQWFDCNNGNTAISGATQQSFTPSISGDYGVTITLTPCQSVNSNCTNLLSNKEFSKEEFIFYPNPNKGELKIKSLIDFDLQIINQIGQPIEIIPIEASNTEQKINLNQLKNGVYILNGISKEGKKLSKKLIIVN